MATANSAQVVATIPQPSGWTAFDAESRTYDPQNKINAVSRLYRASDGSLRQEAFTENGELQFIQIVNVPKKLNWKYEQKTGTWTMRPVVYPEDGYLPLSQKWRVNTPGLRRLPEGYEKLEAYEFQTKDAGLQTMVPILNFYPVRVSSPTLMKELRNINIRPQNSDLFEPPPDVKALEKKDEPFVLRTRTY